MRIVFILLLPFLLNAQASVSETELQSQKLPDGTTIWNRQAQPYSGLVEDFYEREDVRQEIRLENGRRVYARLYRAGELVREHLYRNGRLHGPSRSFFDDRQPYYHDHYADGKRHGWQLGYFADGSLRYLMYYEKGNELFTRSYKKGERFVAPPWPGETEGC